MWVENVVQDGKKYWVTVEGKESFWLYRTELQGLHLEAGMELSDGDYTEIIEQVVAKRAIKRAMYLLEKYDRTKQQLCLKLSENGYPKRAVELAVAYLEGYHYLDDRRYAEHYIFLHKERDSRLKIKCDLQRKGVPKPVICELLEKNADGTQEKGQIANWIQKKQYPKQVGDEKEKHRLYQFLLRKGYSGSDILSALEKAEQDTRSVI